MRGSHHIVAGLAMLGIGRAAILIGECRSFSGDTVDGHRDDRG